MPNPFLTRATKKLKQPKSYWRSKEQEKDLSKRFGARQIIGSGNGFRKGDLYVSGLLRLEAKTTLHKSFPLTRTIIEKVVNAAAANGELPCVVVEFLSSTGKPEYEVAIVPVKDLEGLIHAAKNNSAQAKG